MEKVSEVPFSSARRKVHKLQFLKDVFLLAITAFGGPQAHLAMFIKTLVKEKKYLSEAEFLEINSLCNMLPGPTSTQMITAIGLRLGGAVFAFTTLLVWMLPASVCMTLLVMLLHMVDRRSLSMDFVKFVPAMAVGFLAAAAIRMSQAVIKNRVTLILVALSAVIGVWLNSPYTFPFIIIGGGIVTNFTNQEFLKEPLTGVKIPWRFLAIFFGVLFFAAIVGKITRYRPVLLFENMYHFGSLVFGGGNVLVPMMYEQFVNFKKYLTPAEFATGYGFVQALPGPVFSLSTYTVGMAMQDFGLGGRLVGCLIGTVAIFLPGTLLILFFYPIWQQVKKYPVFRKSLEGLNSSAAGLIIAATVMLFIPILEPFNRNPDLFGKSMLVFGVTLLLVLFTKIKSPFIVIAVVLTGLFW